MRTHFVLISIAAVFLTLNSGALAAPPVLEVIPTEFWFSGTAGGANPENQILSIHKSSGDGPLDWEVSEYCNWLEVDPNSGTSTDETDNVNVIVDISGLSAGSYYCELTVTGDGADNSPQVVSITLNIFGPELTLSATEFSFSALEDGANPDEQTLGIRNSSIGTLNWTIDHSCDWLVVDPNSGSSTGEWDYINLSVDISGLAGGNYNCELTISDPYAADSPQTVDVNLVILGPEMEVSETEFVFMAIEGGANPEDRILSIRNIRGGTLNWEITEDCNWLSTDPNSGGSTGEWDETNISVDISGLSAGNYNCELEISAPNAANSPQIVVVSLYIIGYVEGALYVPFEYETIQAAVDAAVNGDTVIIAPGTYTGDDNRDIDFGGKAIVVRSANPTDANLVADTIIDCNGTETVWHRGFIFQNNEDAKSVIDGLSITRGYAEEGGGIYCFDASPTIKNCIIANNRAHFGITGDPGEVGGPGGDGGGIYCSAGCSPVILNCTISGNAAGRGGTGGKALTIYEKGRRGGNGGRGGGIFCSSATISNCTINGNISGRGGYGGAPDGYTGVGGDGGGIYCSSSTVIENCNITNNVTGGGDPGGNGGGIGGSSFTIRNSMFSENTTGDGVGYPGYSCAGSGGGIYCLSATIRNCIIYQNLTGDGGGLEGCGSGSHGAGIYCSSSTIANCTIAHNVAGRIDDSGLRGIGAGIYCDTGTTIYNTIIWDNSGDELYGQDCSKVGYCDIQYNICSSGNISLNPFFISGPRGDYYLSQTAAGQTISSPCVNAGSDTAANLGMNIFTTRTDEFWDKYTVDIGYHYSISPGSPDIDENLHVDWFDYAILASGWLNCNEESVLPGDITRDTCVNGKDLKILVERWLWGK